MTYFFTAEQLCLFGLSCEVWDSRADAKASGLAYNEETITERMLLDLRRRWPGNVTIQPFSKAEEAKNGADWAWTFVSSDGSVSQSMLVQAKRLNNREVDYAGVKRLAGKPKPPAFAPVPHQIDQLITTAARLNMPPLYAFYNHLSDASRVPVNCRSMMMASLTEVRSWGITLASAHDVKALMPDEQFDNHRVHSKPLHCLLCSGGTGLRRDGGSAAAANAGIAQLVRGIIGDVDDRSSSTALGFNQGLLPMFELAERIAADGSGEPGEGHAGLAQEFPGVAGAVIFRDRKDGRDRPHY